MLTDQSKYQVLPDLIGVAFGELEPERGTSLMLGILPDRLDAFDKEIARGSLRHLRWSLQMLVHAPELVDCAKVGQGLDVLLVPTIGVVLHVQRVRVVQSAT